MKKIEKLILQSCGYTVLLALILYAVLAISGVTDQGIPISKFLVVFGYGLLISIAGALYSYMKAKTPLKLLTHYAILLAGFIVLYLCSGVVSNINPSKIFVAVIIFTVLYVLAAGAIKCLGIAVGKADNKLGKRLENPMPEKKPYTPKFGGNSK